MWTLDNLRENTHKWIQGMFAFTKHESTLLFI